MLLVFLVIMTSGIANAKVLFSDNFEAGLSNDWVFSERGGQDVWKVVDEKGNKILQKTYRKSDVVLSDLSPKISELTCSDPLSIPLALWVALSLARLR